MTTQKMQQETLRVIPRLNFRLAGAGAAAVLDHLQTYDAVHATNQPEWKERGLIFITHNGFDFLLEKGDYRFAY